MAIPQDRYIKINSVVVNETATSKSLSGLVFTTEDMLSSAESDEIKTAYGNSDMISLSLKGVLDYFGKDSEVYKFAEKYFGYYGPDGSPVGLNIVRVDSAENFSTAFTSANEKSSNFGSFCFLGAITPEIAEAVAEANQGLNFAHLFVVPCSNENADAMYEALKNVSGTHLVLGSYLDCFMPMAWVASLDYDKINSASSLFAKTFVGNTEEVTKEEDANTLDAMNINYVGLTQANGTKFSFYQRGVNTDGLSTAVYMNEVWLKSEIARAWFNLISNIKRIPANEDGAAYVENAIMGVVSQAISNGTILIDKPLTATQKSAIIQYAEGNTEAVDSVQQNGYYLHCSIRLVTNKETGKADYHAIYILIYAKGDEIRVVSGTDVLI